MNPRSLSLTPLFTPSFNSSSKNNLSTHAPHRPVTSSVSSKLLQQQICLRVDSLHLSDQSNLIATFFPSRDRISQRTMSFPCIHKSSVLPSQKPQIVAPQTLKSKPLKSTYTKNRANGSRSILQRWFYNDERSCINFLKDTRDIYRGEEMGSQGFG